MMLSTRHALFGHAHLDAPEHAHKYARDDAPEHAQRQSRTYPR